MPTLIYVRAARIVYLTIGSGTEDKCPCTNLLCTAKNDLGRFGREDVTSLDLEDLVFH
jgi:hypothetical protein